jgi:hypothetical protein
VDAEIGCVRAAQAGQANLAAMKENLQLMLKAAIRSGDMQRAWFLAGIIVLLPKDAK